MKVSITFNNNYGAVPYTAALVDTPGMTVMEALEHAFTRTQNVFYSWSERDQADVTVCHHNYDGTPLRSSMVGDEFTVWTSDTEFQKFICDRVGFKEVA